MSGVSAMIKMSSMYIIVLRPKDLSTVMIGLVIFVKTHGVDDSPNGRHATLVHMSALAI